MGVGWTTVVLLVPLLQVVLCQSWKVMMPKKMVTISGSCVTVPCLFEVPREWEAAARNCTTAGVTWRRGPNIHNSEPELGDIVGDVSRKNCTTIFTTGVKNDVFRFRLQCTSQLSFTFAEGVNIDFQEEAPPPQLTSDRVMLAGTRVTMQCRAPMPCAAQPPSITWLPHDPSRKEQLETQQDKEGLMEMVSTVTFNATADHHNQTMTCFVSYPTAQPAHSKQAEASQTLIIPYAPRNTVAWINVPNPVPLGSMVKFTCSSEANPPARSYSWLRLDNGKLSKVGEGDTLFLQTTSMDSGTYLCNVRNLIGTQMSRPVSLYVSIPAAAGSGDSYLALAVTVCAVLVLLYILTVAVDVYKYKLVMRRLKQMELKGDNIYSNLRKSSVTSDYEQIQPPSSGVYENGGQTTTGRLHEEQPRKSGGGGGQSNRGAGQSAVGK